MMLAQHNLAQQQLIRSQSQAGSYAHKPSPLVPAQQNFQRMPPPQAIPTPPHDPRDGPAPRARPQRREVTNQEVIARLQEICSPEDPTTRYRNLSTVGKGASGAVYSAYEVGSNKCVAIKQMNLQQQPKKELIINEIIVMKGSKHKNIVNFLNSYVVVGDLWVVMEYMEGGSLTDVVTFNMMSEGQIAAVCREVRLANHSIMFFANLKRHYKVSSTSTRGMSFTETSSLIIYYYPWRVTSS